jgi:hypothetical protein
LIANAFLLAFYTLAFDFSVDFTEKTADGTVWTYTIEDGFLGNNHWAKIKRVSTSTKVKTIPDTLGGYYVEEIGDFAFASCSEITTMFIPSQIRSIEIGAFQDCSSLTEFSVSSSSKYFSVKNGLLCNNTGTRIIACPPALNSVTIPEDVTKIGNHAFVTCSLLKDLTIPNSVQTIEDNAFYGCKSLERVRIGNGVVRIGKNAFRYADKLYDTNTVLGVKLIDGWVIDSEDKFKGILNLSTIRGVADSAFEGCTDIESVVVGDSVIAIGKKAFYN